VAYGHIYGEVVDRMIKLAGLFVFIDEKKKGSYKLLAI
jgi:hypothetical protein